MFPSPFPPLTLKMQHANIDERELIERWAAIQSQEYGSDEALAVRKAWYSSAWNFISTLPSPGASHWWCRHTAVTQALAEVVAFYNHRLPKSIWERMAEQLGQCGDCINCFHAAAVRPSPPLHAGTKLGPKLGNLEPFWPAYHRASLSLKRPLNAG